MPEFIFLMEPLGQSFEYWAQLLLPSPNFKLKFLAWNSPSDVYENRPFLYSYNNFAKKLKNSSEKGAKNVTV